MLKILAFIIFSCLLWNCAIGAVTETKEKVYYPLNTTAAVETDHVSKDSFGKIVMEGQPPSESIKLNSPRDSSTKEIRKKESKTVPKKGVLDASSEKTDHYNNSTINNPLGKLVLGKTNESSTVSESNKEKLSSTSVLVSSTQKSNMVHIEPAPVHEMPQKPDIVTNDTLSPKPVKKPKPKPLVTIGGKEADEPIPASPTNKSPLGMPRKIDYIVPVVITITALPLLGVTFYMLYKRGRDYWDKRHYRRMDFLIDGMYNE